MPLFGLLYADGRKAIRHIRRRRAVWKIVSALSRLMPSHFMGFKMGVFYTTQVILRNACEDGF